MSELCPFCQIIRGEAPYHSVFEDETTIAFLSNRPVNPGHTLVVPKKHHENIHQMSDEEIAHIFNIVRRVAEAISKALAPEGIRIVQNNGEAAGQVIPHLHVHVIPMDSQMLAAHGDIREVIALESDARRIRRFM
ncbi:MAG TPA: HIT family protein [Candidatus Bathyarchaeia archaeon]